MMHLYLVERSGGRKIDLGRFKYNDVAKCVAVACRRHRFLSSLETNGFDFHAESEPGPYRREKKQPEPEQQGEQLNIEGL